MRTAISIPDDVFQRAERAAKRLGMSRSELFTRAVQEFLGVQRDAEVTASYNQAFGEPGDSESFLQRAGHRALIAVEWKEQ